MDRETEWYRLDNAAKMIPSAMTGPDTRVFRLTCELKEKVDPEYLQEAVNDTVDELPFLNSVLHKGIFWYYMDCTDKPAKVEEDSRALKAIYIPGRKSLMYRVTYFNKRINLEMFHALSDGTGGYRVLEKIVTNYLSKKYNIASGLDENSLFDSASVDEKSEDAFSRFYDSSNKRKRNYIREMFPTVAYKITGYKDPDLYEHLIEGCVSAKAVIDAAHRHDTTVGILVTSLWVEAIIRQMRRSDFKRPVVVSVPVNLRQFFSSDTMRNFFGTIQVTYDPTHYDGNLSSIIPDISKGFKEQLEPQAIAQTMNSYAALEHNFALKLVPLPLKDLGMQGIAYMMKRGVTTSVSNIGKVKLPPEYAEYVDRFAAFMSNKNVFVCISTFNDKMVFGITSAFENHVISKNFFRSIKALGIDVEITSNDNDN